MFGHTENLKAPSQNSGCVVVGSGCVLVVIQKTSVTTAAENIGTTEETNATAKAVEAETGIETEEAAETTKESLNEIATLAAAKTTIIKQTSETPVTTQHMRTIPILK